MKTSRIVDDDLSGLSIEELKAMVRAKNAEIAAKDAELETQGAELHSANVELQTNRLIIESMKMQILNLRRLQFGQRSEKRARQIEQLEFQVEELETIEAASVNPNDSAYLQTQDTESSDAFVAKPKRRREFPAHLPRETQVVEPKESACPDCGDSLKLLGEDVCEFLDLEPLRFKVVRQVRPKLACSGCDTIVQAAAPSRPIERGMVGPGLLAHVIVGKYADHMPLYRQSEIYARDGVDLDRSLLAQWVGGANVLLAPLVDAVRAHVFSADVLHADDTPLPVLAPGRGKTKTGRLWTYVRDERPAAGTAAPAVWFAYSENRKGEHPQQHLENFAGVVHADGYAGYMKVYESGRVFEASCWAHARRKFVELHESHQSPIATEMLDRVGGLYQVEQDVRGKIPHERYAARQSRSRPLLDSMHAWLQKIVLTVSQKSATAKAIRYVLVRWKSLIRYCDDGRIEIDNNAAERSLRCVALGRKNFLFAGSDSGGERAAGLYSLIGTAKLNGHDPEAFLREVLTRISDHPITEIHQLLPWNMYALTTSEPKPSMLAP